MNVIYRITKFQSWGYDSELEISIQKIKVKKSVFNLYFLRNKCYCIHIYIIRMRKI